MKKVLSIIILVLLFSEGHGNCMGFPEGKHSESAKQENNCYQIVGVDHFGRSFNVVSALKTEKQVGLFFFLWIGQPYASGIYDATKILAMPNGL
jgi:hypothetical protein